MTEKTTRGRPVSGRKIVVQIGLDEEDYGTLQSLAVSAKETTSAMGRKLLEAALAKEKKRR